MISTLVIMGQQWWVQAIALSISATGFYFWYTGWQKFFDENVVPLLRNLLQKQS